MVADRPATQLAAAMSAAKIHVTGVIICQPPFDLQAMAPYKMHHLASLLHLQSGCL